MTEKQAERMIEATKDQTAAIKELTRQLVSVYNRLGALLPGER